MSVCSIAKGAEIIDLTSPENPSMGSSITGNAVYICELAAGSPVGHVAVKRLRGIDNPQSAINDMEHLLRESFNEPGKYAVAGSWAVAKYYGVIEYSPKPTK